MNDTYYLERFSSGDWDYGSLKETKPVSRKRVLSGKEIAQRKAKRAMAKRSRKINRK